MRDEPEKAERLAAYSDAVFAVIFTAAMLTALVAPRVGLVLVCGALLLHVRPEAPGKSAAA